MISLVRYFICVQRLLWEKRDARAGNEWDSGGLWANARGRPDVFTCFMYYLE